jgi:hypothetical protein
VRISLPENQIFSFWIGGLTAFVRSKLKLQQETGLTPLSVEIDLSSEKLANENWETPKQKAASGIPIIPSERLWDKIASVDEIEDADSPHFNLNPLRSTQRT